MKAVIYRQAYDEPYHDEIEFESLDEYMKIPCKNCDNGIYHINEEYSEICVECRGTCYKWCNML